jgi:hypothetical protein
MPEGEGPLPRSLAAMEAVYLERGCPRTQPISKYVPKVPLTHCAQNWWRSLLTHLCVACSVMHKHAMELRKMADPEHVHLVPLIEAALAIMRLSCEKVTAFTGFHALQALYSTYTWALNLVPYV